MLFGRRNGDPIDVEVVAETVAEDRRAIIGSVIDEHKRRSLDGGAEHGADHRHGVPGDVRDLFVRLAGAITIALAKLSFAVA
jgi:hypothetical protein